MAKKGLGRGLGALIPTSVDNDEELDEKNSSQILELDIKEIMPNKFQPRRDFNQSALEELALSIKEHGVVQPIVVRKKNNKYELVAGERRWRASQIAGLKTIPAVIKDYSEQEITEIALIENIQREDLNPIEEAWAYKVLLEEFNLTQEELAQKVAKSRSYLANSLRLLNLPEKIKEFVIDGKISTGHARALLILPEAGQIKLAEKIVSEGLTVRDTEKLVKSVQLLNAEQHEEKPKKNNNRQNYDPEIAALEEKLKQFFSTKVNLIHKHKKGKIEIEYYNKEDLNRILELLQIL
ncbi:ParB/RepB/Spo0J family partition protein [Bacillota bacterium LX-D]|nr:ParB/RepB/Spo0J family partition protein [Bacillota bacterium LX-D]